jgi:hypothetical protein
MVRDKEEIEYLKKSCNSIKSDLMRIMDRLEQVGGLREAKSLGTIIGKLEDWQHK